MVHFKKGKWFGLMIMSVILVIMAGCSGGKSPTTSPSSSPSTAAPSPSDNQGGEEKKDYGSIKFVRASNYKAWPEDSLVADYIQEQSGVRPEILYDDPTIGTFKFMIASGEDVDATQMSLNDLQLSIKDGSLLPLTDLIEQYGPNLKRVIDEYGSPDYWNWVKGEDGEIYGIPIDNLPITAILRIRTDWLEEQKLDMPTTIEEFEQAMITFRDAYNTNPLLLERGHYINALAGFFLPHGNSWWKNEEGKWLPPEMQPEYKDMLATLARWYKEGIIHPENFFGNEGALRTQLSEGNKIGAHAGWYSRIHAPFANLRNSGQAPNVEVALVPPLKGGANVGYAHSNPVTGAVVVNVKSKNAEGVIRLLDWMVATQENFTVTRSGLKDVHWEYANEAENIVEKTPKGAEAYGGATFAFINNNRYAGRPVLTNAHANRWHYTYMDVAYDLQPTYTPADLKAHVMDGMLDSVAAVGGDIATAADEARIAIIMNSSPVDHWDELLKTWKDIGIDQIIEEKNKIFNERLK